MKVYRKKYGLKRVHVNRLHVRRVFNEPNAGLAWELDFKKGVGYVCD